MTTVPAQVYQRNTIQEIFIPSHNLLVNEQDGRITTVENKVSLADPNDPNVLSIAIPQAVVDRIKYRKLYADALARMDHELAPYIKTIKVYQPRRLFPKAEEDTVSLKK